MNPGPLRRLVGTFGLLALLPIAYQLLTGGLDPGGAAVRALAVFAVAVVVGRLVGRYLDSVASSVERGVADVVGDAPRGSSGPSSAGSGERAQ